MSEITLKNDKKLFYHVDTARSIVIYSDSFIDETYGKDNKIQSLLIGGYLKISVGDEFNTGLDSVKISYRIKFIEKIGDKYILITNYFNKCTSYITPVIDGDRERLWINEYLINTYLDKEYNYIYLRYRFVGHETYLKLEEYLTRHRQFTERIDQNEFTTFKFRIPDEFVDDCKYFIKGRYSKFSDLLKRRIIKFHKLDPRHRIAQTIFKKRELKMYWENFLEMSLPVDCELDSKPLKSEEIWQEQCF